MKRHEALAPLSRDHHSTLILAQLLKKGAPAYKGLPTDIPGKVNYAMLQFKDIQLHFAKEEEILDKTMGCSEELHALTREIKNEHKQLTILFSALQTGLNREYIMDELGRLLEMHVRKEERKLFPLLEKHCTAAALAVIHELLH